MEDKLIKEFESKCKELGIDPNTQIENMIRNFIKFATEYPDKVNTKILTDEDIERRVQNEK